MSDRVQLEMAEARTLLPSYYATRKNYGTPSANLWLRDRITKLEKFYGKDSGERIRKYMRVVEDTETLGLHEVRP